MRIEFVVHPPLCPECRVPLRLVTSATTLQGNPATRLSCEVCGHPLRTQLDSYGVLTQAALIAHRHTIVETRVTDEQP